MSMSPSSSGHVNMMKGQPFHVKYREIIRRMMFLIGALLVFRLGAHIPVPGINNAALENLFNANQGTILGLFNMFSGGALERMSILALGIMPYISASIIVQLMSTVIPSLEALKKEGILYISSSLYFITCYSPIIDPKHIITDVDSEKCSHY